MTENNENREELRGGALNALHNARAEIRAVHPEGAENIEIAIEGPGAGILALYSAITTDLMEVLSEKAGLPPLIAAKAITDAAGKGLKLYIEK